MTQPRVGVACIVLTGDTFLLVRRRGTRAAGTCSSPGGNLDFGEEPAACAVRESEEETGVVADTPRFVGLTIDVFESENKHDLTLGFESEHVQGEPHVRSPDELSDVGWFGEDELPVPLFLSLQNLLGGRRIV